MKMCLIGLSLLSLLACSAKPPAETVVLDQQTLQEYQHKVLTGDTIPTHQKRAYSDHVEMPLNASDYRVKYKPKRRARPQVILMPSMRYHYDRWD